MTVGQYRNLIGCVTQWSASVKSAANATERAGEVEHLKSAVAELRAAGQGKRIKIRDLERAAGVLMEADRLIASSKG